MGKAGQKTLLLVEDKAIILLATAAILKRHGFTVITAGNGESAVEMARIHAGIDLILMDIDLGAGMDGPQAVVDRTERITSYGYIVKNSGETVLLASIRMAFRLWESEQRFRTAFENVQVGMVLTSPRGSLLRVNESFAEMLGYTRQEATAADFATLTHPDDVGANVANMQAMLRGETDRMHFSKRYLHRDGRVV